MQLKKKRKKVFDPICKMADIFAARILNDRQIKTC